MEQLKIGMDIVALKNHCEGDYQEGDVFTVQDLSSNQCKCGILVNIGLIDHNVVGHIGKLAQCPECNSYNIVTNENSWYFPQNFKPLDTLVNIEELTEILSEPIELLFS